MAIGKAAGAPFNAITGWEDGGNLWREGWREDKGGRGQREGLGREKGGSEKGGGGGREGKRARGVGREGGEVGKKEGERG